MFVANLLRTTFPSLSFRCRYCTKISRQLILGVETSCDDTAAALIDESGRVISEKNHSQLQVHLDSGGVIPIVARNLHNEYLDDVVYETLHKSGFSMNDVTLVAVTNRPGLPLSLRVGTDYAKKLAIKYNKPLIPIHHMEAHATTASLFDETVSFPFLSLLISGGHSQLAFFKDINTSYLLGEALDDAPGEVMDKVARRMRVKNLGPPFDSLSGGAALEILAQKGHAKNFPTCATPMYKERNCNFSFSGFKSVLGQIEVMEKESNRPIDEPIPQIHDIAAAIFQGITLHILQRLARAIEFIEGSKIWKHDFDPTNSIYKVNYSDQDEEPLKLQVVISGGVACNDFIIDKIRDYCSSYEGIYNSTNITVHTPRPKKWCSDNAVMIAWNALLHLRQNSSKIRTTREEIESVDTFPKAQLGINISKMVANANIKPRKIKLTDER